VVAVEGGIVGIDDAAAIVHGRIVGVNPGDLKHGDEQGCLVFAIAILVAEDVGGVIGLQTPNAAHDDEVADVLLNGIGDAAEFGLEVRRAGGEALHLCGDFGGGCRAICFQCGDPLADGAPLVVNSLDRL
jgi:hypothetical protein